MSDPLFQWAAECPHGKVLICSICRPPSKEMEALAARVVAQQEARTTAMQGDPCPCGRGAATRGRCARYECEACVKDAHEAALRFLMDDSFGGP